MLCFLLKAPSDKCQIHPFACTFIHRWQRMLCKVPTCSLGAIQHFLTEQPTIFLFSAIHTTMDQPAGEFSRFSILPKDTWTCSQSWWSKHWSTESSQVKSNLLLFIIRVRPALFAEPHPINLVTTVHIFKLVISQCFSALDFLPYCCCNVVCATSKNNSSSVAALSFPEFEKNNPDDIK